MDRQFVLNGLSMTPGMPARLHAGGEHLREKSGKGSTDAQAETRGEAVENELRFVLGRLAGLDTANPDLVRQLHARQSKVQRRPLGQVDQEKFAGRRSTVSIPLLTTMAHAAAPRLPEQRAAVGQQGGSGTAAAAQQAM